MSRRKQARPSRHLECDEDGIPSAAASVKKDDKRERWNDGRVGDVDGTSCHRSSDLLSSSNDDDEMDDRSTAVGHPQTTIPHTSNFLTDEDDDDIHTEDANNNESKSRDVADEKDVDSKELQKESLTTALHSLIGGNFPWPEELEKFKTFFVGPNVTLEAIQNTKVAVAQFAANALHNSSTTKNSKNSMGGGGGGEGGSFQELAALQSTLLTLQQQQLLQLQLLQHLQQQLVSKSSQNSVQHDDSSPPNSPSPVPSKSTTPQPPEVNQSSNSSSQLNLSPLKHHSKPSQSTHASTPVNNHLTNNSCSPPTNTSTTPITHSNGSEALNPHFASLLNCANPNQDPNQPLSPGCYLPHGTSSSSILSPNGDLNIIREPNSLEMLQKRTQEVLDSASQGLLASSLVDDPNYRKKGGLGIEKGREPFFKHRCRYCGKVFSSDSALQIHIRSHTGERPFKCNVCGSRFTTKGNLKVHFQRHTTRFPHVRMNPHPIPEHLDHLHPPIRPNSGHSTPNHSPTGSNPFRTPPPPPPQGLHPFNPLFHFSHTPMKLIPLAVPVLSSKEHHILSSGPEDLTKPKGKHDHHSDDELKSRVKEEFNEEEEDEEDDMENEDDMMDEDDIDTSDNHSGGKDDDDKDCSRLKKGHHVNSSMHNNNGDHVHHHHHVRDGEEDDGEEEEERTKKEVDDCSMDSMNLQEHDQTDTESMMMMEESSSQDQPENLSSKSLQLMYPVPLTMVAHHPSRPSSTSTTMTTFARISPASPQFQPGSSQLLSTSKQQQPTSHSQPPSQGIPGLDLDPSKDPAIYTSLLPRPGSNDNAWESLIEVTKTSETAKLQQLVDNIDHKVTDPNQCIICQRVLSCKSALQMHYRTHTGERPFKCKICSRTFTTKGNLKTHMGVHRAKPPLRALLQCPVCHKRFTNSLVLQQHIRLHTGEPTDLTPDQIRAAEVKDFTFLPSNHFPPFPPHGSPPLFLTHHHPLMKHPIPTSLPSQQALQSDDSASSPPLNPNFKLSREDSLSPQMDKIPSSPHSENISSPNFSPSLSENHGGNSSNRPIVKSQGNSSRQATPTSSPQNGNSSTEDNSPSNTKQDQPLALNSNSSPAAQQQQPFITSTIIPHNNLQFLKVNYVFVK